ncbi:MAG TPA: LLM class F420-dependent oxidoreductase [Thermomicrobiales bacterium]|nr:LLM class F420-dependent oxidoreductase [Thermomicrobiales bacterium]
MEVSIMIEGQQGLSWPRWQRLVHAAEDLGFDGIYRSDHFVEPQGNYQDALELWVSFAWLAANTSRIQFSPLVSPVSFRDPVITAWQASGVDALAGGRLRLGLGAGWNAREHEAFGYELLDVPQRFARFEEGLQVICRLLRENGPVTFEGDYYQLRNAQIAPRSPRENGPPILIGGNGPKRTLPLVAKYADEWNATSMPMDDYRERTQRLNELLEEQGRKPEDVKRTVMRRGVIGRDDTEVNQKLDGADKEAMLARGLVIGTPSEVVEILGTFAEAGIDGVMLQWLDMDDISGLELLAAEVLPQVR